MLSIRQSITIFISIVAVTGAEVLMAARNLSVSTAIANSNRLLNTFTVLDPASAPVYFGDTPKNPLLPPAPTVSSYPTASLPDATGDALTPRPSSRPTKGSSNSPTLSPLWNAKDATSSIQPSPSTTAYYPSISPLSTVLSTLPYSSQTLSPSAANDSPSIGTSLPNLPNFPLTPTTLSNFIWPVETTAQPARDGHSFSGYGETIPPTPGPSERLSIENLGSSRTQLPGADQLQNDDDPDEQKKSSYFETPIPKIQINIEVSSAERRHENDLLRDKVRSFFLELLASSPNSASFVTADLLVIVASSSPLEVLVTGKMFYEQNDLPTTQDITAQLRTYFSYWGTGHLNEYLGSDRVLILLNGVPVSSQASEGETSDNSALPIILSVILIVVAISMIAFGVFTYQHVRQKIVVHKKQEATPPKESHPNTYPTNIVMTSSGSLESVYNYEEADRESVAPYPHRKRSPYSVDDEASKTSEEEYGPCSL